MVHPSQLMSREKDKFGVQDTTSAVDIIICPTNCTGLDLKVTNKKTITSKAVVKGVTVSGFLLADYGLFL